MYTTANRRDLEFMRTPTDIYDAVRAGELKLISITSDLEMRSVSFPFVLPNTLRFADSLAFEYRAACGQRIVVTSGSRPLDKQPGNASPKSVHPTGMAIDFRRPANPGCLTWLRKALVKLEDAGVVEATEERHPPHFHVAVLRQKPERRGQAAAGDVAKSVVKGPSKTTAAGGAAAEKATKSRAKAVASP